MIDFLQVVRGDYAGHGGGLYRVPFGVAARRAPRVLVDSASENEDGRVTTTVWCDQPCRLQATAGGRRAEAAVTDAFGTAPLTTKTNATRLRMTITARAHGRSTRTVAVLRRTAPGQWAVISAARR